MALDRDTRNQIIDLLTPYVASEAERNRLVMTAFYGYTPLISGITLTGDARTFASHVVDQADKYGDVETGQPALVLLLQELKQNVGVNVQAEIDALIARVRELSMEPEPPPEPDFRINQLEGSIMTEDQYPPLEDTTLNLQRRVEQLKGERIAEPEAAQTQTQQGGGLPMRTIGGVVAGVLALLFAFLALFPEETRTEWFEQIGLIQAPTATVTPQPTDTPEPTEEATNTPQPTDAPDPTDPPDEANPSDEPDEPAGNAAASSGAAAQIQREEDLLAFVVSGDGTVSLDGFAFISDDTSYNLDGYPAFQGLTFGAIDTPVCFVLREQGSNTPLPLGCQSVPNNSRFVQQLSSADNFWYDSVSNQAATLALQLDGESLGFCPAGTPSCDVELP